MKLLHTISGKSNLNPNYFSISTDSKTLISNAHSLVSSYEQYENVNFWDLSTGELIRRLDFPHDHISIGCYEKWLLGISGNATAIKKINLETEEFTLILDAAPSCLTSQKNNVTLLVMSPFEPIFACGDCIYNASQIGKITVYNLLADSIIQDSYALRLSAQIFQWEPQKYPSCNSSVLISPDSNRLLSQAVRTRYGSHHLWNLQTGKLIRTSSASNSALAECLALNHIGQILACGLRAKQIQVWDVHTEKIICSVEGNLPITMSIDGRFLAYCLDESKIILHDIKHDRHLCTLNKSSATIKQIALSPDGKWLASYNQKQTIEIWCKF